MDRVTLLLLVQFAFATSITPGPNNIMLLASGATYGFRRTVPHMLGISLGHALMVTLVGVALLRLFERIPWLIPAIGVGAVLYMSWLAWKIATAVPPETEGVAGRPFTFLQAAAFQWVNPKAWVMAITAITAYAPMERGVLLGSLAVAAVFMATNLPAIALWAGLGVQMRRWLGTRRRLRIFNGAMAALLMLSLWSMLAQG